MLECPFSLLGNVDLAFLQPLDQIIWRQVYQFDRISAVKHTIRNGFTNANTCNLRDNIIEAFNVLYVDRGIDVDATIEQLLDIQVALGVPAGWCIGVSQFVD